MSRPPTQRERELLFPVVNSYAAEIMDAVNAECVIVFAEQGPNQIIGFAHDKRYGGMDDVALRAALLRAARRMLAALESNDVQDVTP